VPDIFLSYNRVDQATARRFAEGFEREGLKLWWDVGLTPGEAYDEDGRSAGVACHTADFNFALIVS